MGVRVSFLYMPLFLLFPCFFCKFSPKQNADNAFSTTSETMCVSSKRVNEHAHIFIYYPIEKPGIDFSIYLNKKKVANLNTGVRLECRLLQEGAVTVTIAEGNKNTGLLTAAKSSQIITIKKGRAYYFRVNSSGRLNVMEADKGISRFASAKEFTHSPGQVIKTTDAPLAVVNKIPAKNSRGTISRQYLKVLLLNFSKLFW